MNSPSPVHPDAQSPPLFVEAAAVVDAGEVSASPGALLLDVSGSLPKVLAAGSPGEVSQHPMGARARRIERPDRVVVPALVNAHVHLDLTHIGARPFDRERGFTPWVDVIRDERATSDEAIAASTLEGVRRSIAGGVAVVGDIAGVGSVVPARALAASGLMGVSFVEFFGVGARQAHTIDAMRGVMEAAGGIGNEFVRVGLQPHAPYSAGLGVFAEAIALSGGRPIATHLGETPEESRFVCRGDGPQRALLERLGAWDDSVLDDIAHGRSPVRHLGDVLRAGRVLAAHVNEASDRDLDVLRETGTCVAYCPRCSAYFGREQDFGAHRYLEMMEMGITVALGTDSVVNLSGAGGERLSVLDEMRSLQERDGADARTLLGMGTTSGLRAIGFDTGLGDFGVGDVAGVIALEGQTLEEAITRAGAIEWLAGRLCD